MAPLHFAYRTHADAAGGEEIVHLTDPAGGRRQVRLSPGGAGPAWVELMLDAAPGSLTFAARPGVLHYLRLADATLAPLPPAHAPARHAVLPWQAHWHGPTLQLTAGDCYVLVSPGAAEFADSPRVARFLHLRDDFNAGKLAETLLAHLLEEAPTPLARPVTVLVVEAR